MGTTTSKPNAPIVLHGETPVRFSSSFVHTLTSTSESDSTREKQLELHIQSRVAEELARLEEREEKVLRGVQERIESGKEEEGGLGREKVKMEIEGLKKRLQDVPRVAEIGEDVEKARGEVVRCLRLNDTRPLDCWKEVEEFKEQTRRLEKAFVVRTVGREY
ncbi:DUF1690-domain-containing protein [Wilcoxina mikolae CBS 423.85]|nr:DUF1690-domain-containing protein [Wilcoxina mikolae CBS 423.85]